MAGCSTAKPAARTSPPPGLERRATTPLTNAVATFDAAWEIIYHTHFDTNFNGVDWVAMRERYAPPARAADSEKALRTVIQDMLDELGQSHMMLIPREVAEDYGLASAPDDPTDPELPSPEPSPEGRGERVVAPAPTGPRPRRTTGSGTPGIEVRWLNQQIVVTGVRSNSAAAAAGVKPGWVLERIGDQPIAELVQLLSGGPVQMHESVLIWSAIQKKFKGPATTFVPVEFRDGRKRRRRLNLERQLEPGAPVKLGNLPTFIAEFRSRRIPLGGKRSAGYLTFNVWMTPIAAPLERAVDELRDTDGLILDLRGNIGGLAALIIGISGHFFDEEILLGTIKMREGTLNLRANPRRVTAEGKGVQPYSRPLAILTDEITLSASEIFAGGMQTVGRARIFGQKTAGAALPAAFDQLPNGDVLMHAYGDFIMPNGARLEAKGVVPDELVKPSRTDLLAGRDPVLEAALAWIRSAR